MISFFENQYQMLGFFQNCLQFFDTYITQAVAGPAVFACIVPPFRYYGAMRFARSVKSVSLPKPPDLEMT